MVRIYAFLTLLLFTAAPVAFSQTQFTCYPVGAEETPPNPSLGWGVGRFVLSADEDTLYYSLFWRIPNTYSASHIHPGAPGFQNPPVHTLLNANASGAHGAWAIDAPNLALLLAGHLYINVHSLIFPNGEIRAQILQLPLHPEDDIYDCVMNGNNEVPPNATTSWGLGTFRLNATLDSLYYAIMWRLNNTFASSHIHAAPAGVNGGIVLNFGTGAHFTGTHGVWAISVANVALLNTNGLYVNAHTNIFGGGEIRDQIHYNPLLPPVPNIQVSLSDVDFPTTYVGQTSQMSVQVTNTGTGPLIVTELFGTNQVWSYLPTSFTLNPEETQDMELFFNPSYTHNFIGQLEIHSNDPDAPPTIDVSGTGCNPGITPGVPVLYPSGSPNAIYFSIPWDLNDHSTLYAVEYSSDNFANSLFVDEFGYGNDLPQWSTAGMWGTESAGAILGLESETTYQVRLGSSYCDGAELWGSVSEMTTPAPVPHVDEAELTITVSDADHNDVVLRWNTVTVNADGDTLPNLGFEVYYTQIPDESTPIEFLLVGFETDGDFTYDTNGETFGRFKVVPIIEDFGQPHPFIAWPPNGATVSGWNQIIIKDHLHKTQNDAFIIYMDNVIIGTELDNPFTESDKMGIAYDFSDLPEGVYTATVVVVDQFGVEHNGAESQDWYVDSTPPYVQFVATFDSASQVFVCDTTLGENVDDILAIYWQNTQGQEGYGSSFDFKWEGPDSLVLVKPIAVPDYKVLTENSPTDYLYPLEYAGLTPTTVSFWWTWIEIGCCCEMIELSTGGNAEGEYHGQKNRGLGAFVRCEGDKYSVSYAFEVDITWRFFLGAGGMCTYGQDCKRTETTTVGNCVDGAFVTYIGSSGQPITKTSHKKHGGTDYPRSGSDYGNDGYGNRPGDSPTGVDNSELGHSRWYDRPRSTGTLPKNSTSTFAIRIQRSAQFLAKAEPPCDVGGCCITWDLDWDVTFCEDCTIIQTVPPAITNYMSPVSCPALAE